MDRSPSKGAPPKGPTGSAGDSSSGAPARPEMGDAPPFATWPRIYALVIGALAVQVVLYAALTAAYR